VLPLRTAISVAILTAAAMAAGASSASASVSLGQLPVVGTGTSCGLTPADRAQPTVISGNSYVVPGTGTITSWSHSAGPGTGQKLTLKIFRKLTDPLTYTVVGHDGPEDLSESSVNTFAASIPVKPGDVVGNAVTSPSSPVQCSFPAPGDSMLQKFATTTDGQPVTFMSVPDNRLNISAVFTPANAFILGSTKRNKKKGTATLEVTVPNSGELGASGKGVKTANAASIAKVVGAPGAATLTIKASGKKKSELKETGKVKLATKITFTPTGGDPSTQSLKLKLKKTG
jgi:hypothetical protein